MLGNKPLTNAEKQARWRKKSLQKEEYWKKLAGKFIILYAKEVQKRHV